MRDRNKKNPLREGIPAGSVEDYARHFRPIEGQVVHRSVFDLPKNEQEGRRFSRMGSFSNRSRNQE
jgi:hypothetical protein